MTDATTYPDLAFRRYLGYSAWFHIGLIASLLVGVWLERSGNPWGGPGGGDSDAKVNLVSSAGIPMPRPNIPATSDVVDPTKGLGKEEPPKIEPNTDAMKLPEFNKKKPLPPSKPSKVLDNKQPPPDNTANYGKGGGQLNVQRGYSDTPGAAASGLAMQGPGGGDFASRYGWYVESVRRAISQNWIQASIDPQVRAARRAKTSMTFRINRDGTIRNIRMENSSGNRSMDDSANRALLSIDKLPNLPADYSGSYVDVTFDFDLSMLK